MNVRGRPALGLFYTWDTSVWDSVRLHCQYCVKGPTTVVGIRHNSCCSHCKYLHTVGTPHVEGFSLSVVWQRSSHANKTRGGDLVCLLLSEEDGKLKLTSLRSSRSHKLPLNFDLIFSCLTISSFIVKVTNRRTACISPQVYFFIFLFYSLHFLTSNTEILIVKSPHFYSQKTEFISDFPF